MDKAEEWGLGIGAVAIIGGIVYLLMQGSTSSSSGVAVTQANPASVASLYSAQASDTAAQAGVDQAGIQAQSAALSSVVGLVSTENTNATSLGLNGQNTGAAIKINSQNTNAATTIAAGQVNAANYATAMNNQTAQVQSGNQTNLGIALGSDEEGSAIGVATQAAQASETASAAQQGSNLVADQTAQNIAANNNYTTTTNGIISDIAKIFTL